MRTARWPRWTALGLLALALVAAVALLISSRALYQDYQPSTTGLDGLAVGGARGSTPDWLGREHAAAITLLVLAALAAVASLVVLVTRRRWPWAVALVGSLVAVLGAVAALATRTAVQWDQLALWSVTVGADLKGYQAATGGETGGDMVRFVIVDGREVSTTDYTLTLATHMYGVALAVVGLLIALVVALVWGGDQAVKRSIQAAISSTAETASGNAG
jgi:hypothetical protein